MSVKVSQYSTNVNTNGWYATEWIDTTQTQRETTKDGQTFHWATNQDRNFLDDGVGAAHAAFGGIGVVEDAIPFGSSRA